MRLKQRFTRNIDAPKLLAEEISKRALIIVSINKTCLYSVYMFQVSKDPLTFKMNSDLLSLKICLCLSMLSSEEILCLKPRENKWLNLEVSQKMKPDAISIDRSSRDCSVGSMLHACYTMKRNNKCF